MSEHINKSHSVSLLMYHLASPIKYRKVVFSEEIIKALVSVCFEIEERFEINFIEIGSDKNHVHFLVQSMPSYSPSEIVRIIKSITAREIFKRHEELKAKLWGGNLWSAGYYINTVGKMNNEEAIKKYIKEQGQAGKYQKHYQGQLKLF